MSGRGVVFVEILDLVISALCVVAHAARVCAQEFVGALEGVV